MPPHETPHFLLSGSDSIFLYNSIGSVVKSNCLREQVYLLLIPCNVLGRKQKGGLITARLDKGVCPKSLNIVIIYVSSVCFMRSRHKTSQNIGGNEKKMSNKSLTTVSILIAVLIVGWYTGLAEAKVVEEELAGYWTLDKASIDGEILADVLGEHDGTIMGNPEIVEGIVGEALSFNGEDDYVVIGPVTDGQNLTYSFWIKVEALPKGNQVVLWDDDSSGGGDAWFHLMANGKIQSQRGGDGLGVLTSESAITPEEWMHIAFVANVDTDERRLYINGKRDVVGGGPVKSRTNISHVVLAVGHDSGAFIQPFYFAGAIDEVAIYNRALSDEEIQGNSSTLAVSPVGNLSLTWGSIKSN